MKTALIALIAVLTVPASLLASSSSEQNIRRLGYLSQNRNGTDWACQKGSIPEAAVMFSVRGEATGTISSNHALAIEDPQICSALRVTCPFIAGAGVMTYLPSRRFQYWATNGKNEDTVAFFSDGAGMKLVRVSNGSQPAFLWELNWYFQPGECVQPR